jgi:hypothetical protein
MSAKSIGAVLAGMTIAIVLSVATDLVLEALGIFPSLANGLFSTKLLLLATLYRCVYTALGGYVTATLSPDRPQLHVRTLAILALAGNLIGLVATWGKGLGPEWYPMLLTVLAYPSVWLGGRFKTNRS